LTTSFNLFLSGGQLSTLWVPSVLPITVSPPPVGAVGLLWDFTSFGTAERLQTLTLTVTVSATSTTNALTVKMPTLYPRLDDYATHLPLSFRNTVTLATHTGFVSGIPTLVELDMGGAGALTHKHVGSEVGDWVGYLPLVLTFSLSTTVTGLALAGTTYPSFTGLEGPYLAEGRADLCPKCGGPSTRDLWVRDGYLKIFVCERCYDPPDLYGRARPRPEKPGVNED
jgi:hypothetical protein